MLMKFFALIILLMQQVPTEDLIYSAKPVGSIQTQVSATPMKPAWIYYNDTTLVVHTEGKTGRYAIYSKRYDAQDKNVVIVCYDSVAHARYGDRLAQITPSLKVTIDYNATVNGRPFPDVDCWFMAKGVRLGFGFEAKRDLPNKLKYTGDAR